MYVRPGARCHRELPLSQYLRPWPGPNSNTFLAHTARQVPDLAIQLPSNAVGKDFLPGGRVVALAPSGSGFQVLPYGLIGILFAAGEGLELNLLGSVLKFDPGQAGTVAAGPRQAREARRSTAGAGARPAATEIKTPLSRPRCNGRSEGDVPRGRNAALGGGFLNGALIPSPNLP